MTEKELQTVVLSLAGVTGWLRYHTYDSRRSHPGFPDVVLVRDGEMLCVELKSEKGRVTPDQRTWLDAMGRVPGVQAHVWRPEDWFNGAIERALTGE